MKATETSYQQPEVMLVGHMLDPNLAARLLCANLGRTADYWLLFLREERHPRIDPKDWAIPFTEFEGEFWYDEGELYRFIARSRSEGFSITEEQVEAISFYCEPRADIDYQNKCRFVMYLAFPQGHVRPWLSINDARELAKSLINTADWCDRHRYDAETGKIITARTESLAVTGVSHE